MAKKVKEEVLEEVKVEETVVPTIKVVNMDLSDAGIAYQTYKSAGLDLTISEDIVIYRDREPVMLKTGLRLLNVAVEGVFGLLALRSSIRKQGLSIMGVGIIDIDYEGEIVIPCVYYGPKTGVKLMKGERVAQLTLIPFLKFDNDIKYVERGAGGFGST